MMFILFIIAALGVYFAPHVAIMLFVIMGSGYLFGIEFALMAAFGFSVWIIYIMLKVLARSLPKESEELKERMRLKCEKDEIDAMLGRN